MRKKNVVLIGMMGCGKSTIGRALSYRLKMPFIDLDAWIERREGKTINEIFAQAGEAEFRKIEHRIVKEVSAWGGHIISTGGGVVLQPENMEALKRNGLVVFINRPVEEIAKNVNIRKRPLLKDGPEKLFQLKKERFPLYRKYADLEIVNRGSFRDGLQNAYRKIRPVLLQPEERSKRMSHSGRRRMKRERVGKRDKG